MVDITNEVIWGSSKFLYPSKIDMTPLECDVWIAEVTNNLENYVTNTIFDKHKDTLETIVNAIKSAKFMMYYKDEIKAKVDSLVKWLTNEKKVKVSEDKKSNFFTKKSLELADEYLKNISKKIQEEKFINFLVSSQIGSENYNKIKDNLFAKIKDPDICDTFTSIINNDKDEIYSFVKEIIKIIKELEFPKKYCFHRVYYWRTEKTHCELVKRDREWFSKSLPIFENMWKNIEFLRENPESFKIVQEYINSLETKEVHYGKEIKDNNKVMKFIDLICNPPNEKKADEKEIKKYGKNLKKIMDEK
jgi:hypothetical protein